MTRTFCGELSLVIPNADYIKRKPIGVKQIVEQAVAHGYTDVLIVNEKDKKPSISIDWLFYFTSREAFVIQHQFLFSSGSLLHVHLPNGPTAFYRVSSVRLIRDTHAPRRARKARRRATDPYRELRHPASCPEPSTASASSSSQPALGEEVKSEAEEEEDDGASDEDVEAIKSEPEADCTGEDCDRSATAAPVAEQMQLDEDGQQEEGTQQQETGTQQQRGRLRVATGALIRGRVFIERPELVINNMRTRLGRSLARMIAALFPADANLAARRVVAFHNQRDFVFFRHYKCLIFIRSLIHCSQIFN